MVELNDFILREYMLTNEMLLDMLDACNDKDLYGLFSLAEDLECIILVSQVTDRLPGWMESVGTIDYRIMLHKIKSVYYDFINLDDEVVPGAYQAASGMLMRDMFKRIKQMIERDSK